MAIPRFLSLRAERSNLHRSAHLDGDFHVVARPRNPVRLGVTFIVLAGPVPAISRGTVPLQMAGTGPAMTVRAGFIQGGSVSASRCGTRNDRGSSDCPER